MSVAFERALVDTRAMRSTTVTDGQESFEVATIHSDLAERVVLFAAGAGGDPARHGPLLELLAAKGCSVIAPRFERFTSPMVTEAQLVLRARRLQLALGALAPDDARVVGVGHSIGAMLLLAMAGAQPWMGPDRPLALARDARLEAVAMLAPAAGYFAAPGALAAVSARVAVWAGQLDTTAPPAGLAFLSRELGPRCELHSVEGADHYSFMNVRPPPSPVDPLPDPAAFHRALAEAVAEFALRSR